MPARPAANPILSSARFARVAVLGGAAVGLAATAGVHAAPTWVSRWSSVGASVGFGDSLPDAEERGSASLGDADLTASASQYLGMDDFAGDYIGGTATAMQTSMVSDDGLFARLDADLFAGEGDEPLDGREAVSVVKALLQATFTLDAPHDFGWGAFGTLGDPIAAESQGFGVMTGGTATIDGKTTGGEHLTWSADFGGDPDAPFEPTAPFVDTLPAGTWTLRHDLTIEVTAGSASLDLPIEFFLGPALGSIDPDAAAIPESAMVVPLPSAGWAGLATVGAIAAVGAGRRRRSA